MNRGPSRNDGGRYSTPRGRGRGRGRSPSRSAGSSYAHHNGPVMLSIPSLFFNFSAVYLIRQFSYFS